MIYIYMHIYIYTDTIQIITYFLKKDPNICWWLSDSTYMYLHHLIRIILRGAWIMAPIGTGSDNRTPSIGSLRAPMLTFLPCRLHFDFRAGTVSNSSLLMMDISEPAQCEWLVVWLSVFLKLVMHWKLQGIWKCLWPRTSVTLQWNQWFLGFVEGPSQEFSIGNHPVVG